MPICGDCGIEVAPTQTICHNGNCKAKFSGKVTQDGKMQTKWIDVGTGKDWMKLLIYLIGLAAVTGGLVYYLFLQGRTSH